MRVSRRAKSSFGHIYKGQGEVKPLPALKEGQIRCICGRGVSLINGRLRRHKTLKSEVPCVYGGREFRA